MDQVQLDRNLTAFETGLNYAGYVPIVSSCTAVVRAIFGTVEIICGVATAAIFAFRALLVEGAAQRKEEWDKAYQAIRYGFHGYANIVRAFFEIVPFVSLVTCLPFDLSGERLHYPTQSIRMVGNTIIIGPG